MGENASEARRTEAPPKSLFIFHMARSPEGRTARRLRPGNRQGFVLDDGVRVRRKGKRRVTEIGFDAAIQNIAKIIDGVKHSYIRVSLDGDGKQPVLLEQLEGLAEPGTLKAWKGARDNHAKLVQAGQRANQLHAEQEARLAKVVELETAIEKVPEALDEMSAKGNALEEELATLKEEAEDASEELFELEEAIKSGRAPEPEEEAEEEEEPSDEEKAAADEAAAESQAGEYLAAVAEGNTNALPALASLTSAYPDSKWSQEVVAKLGELRDARKAAQEKAEAEEKARQEAEDAAKAEGQPAGDGEEGEGEGDEEEVWDLQSLTKLNRDELNRVASEDFKVKDPEQYSTKKDLATKILESGEGGEE